MEPREQRGLAIAATTKLTQRNGLWSVPSQSGNGRYAVSVWSDGHTRCNCPDFEERGLPCKHIYAVQYTMKRELTTITETDTEGVVTETVTETVTESVKVTYGQNWPAYNAAQQHEKRLFLPLLRDLCQSVEEPLYDFGRPRFALQDMIFACAYKTYSTVSARRFASDLYEAHSNGYLTKLPHYNSVINYFENADMTPTLEALIELSASPLKSVETRFAVDSTGFGTSRHETWTSVRHGGMVSRRDWVKVHAIVGTQTNIITSAHVTNHREADSPHLPQLVNATAATFNMQEVSADKGYSSAKNHVVIDAVGATPFIAFKTSTTGTSATILRTEGGALWQKMFHYYSFNREDFLQHYHNRSNIESTFSMIKAKFGDSVRSKTETAQINEALLKILCHNICVVIQSIFELGIEPTFAAIQ